MLWYLCPDVTFIFFLFSFFFFIFVVVVVGTTRIVCFVLHCTGKFWTKTNYKVNINTFSHVYVKIQSNYKDIKNQGTKHFYFGLSAEDVNAINVFSFNNCVPDEQYCVSILCLLKTTLLFVLSLKARTI